MITGNLCLGAREWPVWDEPRRGGPRLGTVRVGKIGLIVAVVPVGPLSDHEVLVAWAGGLIGWTRAWALSASREAEDLQ